MTWPRKQKKKITDLKSLDGLFFAGHIGRVAANHGEIVLLHRLGSLLRFDAFLASHDIFLLLWQSRRLLQLSQLLVNILLAAISSSTRFARHFCQ